MNKKYANRTRSVQPLLLDRTSIPAYIGLARLYKAAQSCLQTGGAETELLPPLLLEHRIMFSGSSFSTPVAMSGQRGQILPGYYSVPAAGPRRCLIEEGRTRRECMKKAGGVSSRASRRSKLEG